MSAVQFRIVSASRTIRSGTLVVPLGNVLPVRELISPENLDGLVRLKETQQQGEPQMEQLIQHYLKRLTESTLTPEQRKLYQGLLDEYSALYLQEIYS